MNNFIFYSKDYCYMCLKNKTKNYICKDCIERLEFIDGIRELDERICIYPLFYNNFLRSLIKKFKYEDCTYLVKPFVEIIYKFIKFKNLDFDYISYIPMYYKDEYERGYNQSKILCEYYSKTAKKEMIQIIEKVKPTNHQNKLDRKMRLKNLKDSFKVIEGLNLDNKRILFIDDIVTTGSTFNLISKEIKKKYDCEITFLAIASSKIYENDE